MACWKMDHRNQGFSELDTSIRKEDFTACHLWLPEGESHQIPWKTIIFLWFSLWFSHEKWWFPTKIPKFLKLVTLPKTKIKTSPMVFLFSYGFPKGFLHVPCLAEKNPGSSQLRILISSTPWGTTESSWPCRRHQDHWHWQYWVCIIFDELLLNWS